MCLDEMGPESAKSYPGRRLVQQAAAHQPTQRAQQEIDYGRRGRGYVFGAFKPADGDALTATYPRRTTAHFVEFLEQVER